MQRIIAALRRAWFFAVFRQFSLPIASRRYPSGLANPAPGSQCQAGLRSNTRQVAEPCRRRSLRALWHAFLRGFVHRQAVAEACEIYLPEQFVPMRQLAFI
jgi:hypothetical protein